MKREIKNTPVIFNSISELHRAMGLPKPLHPLVCLVDYGKIKIDSDILSKSFILNFYKISYKKISGGK